MSIYKSEHRDDSRTIWRMIKGLFGKPCNSHIAPPNSVSTYCTLKMGHSERHTNGKISWAYGDDYFAL